MTKKSACSVVEESDRPQRYLCLVESRGAATELGFAAFDADLGCCDVGQFADSSTFPGLCRQIYMFQPSLIIMTSPSHADVNTTGIYLVCQEVFKEIPIEVIDR